MTREDVVAYLSQCREEDIVDICNEAIRAGWRQIKFRSFGPTTITLSGFGDKKIHVIKICRCLLGLGLKEAKERVEATPTDPWTFEASDETIRRLTEASSIRSESVTDEDSLIEWITRLVGASNVAVKRGRTETDEAPEASLEHVEPGPLRRDMLLLDD